MFYLCIARKHYSSLNASITVLFNIIQTWLQEDDNIEYSWECLLGVTARAVRGTMTLDWQPEINKGKRVVNE